LNYNVKIIVKITRVLELFRLISPLQILAINLWFCMLCSFLFCFSSLCLPD